MHSCLRGMKHQLIFYWHPKTVTMSAFITHCCTIAMLSGVARWEGHLAPILSAEVLACVLVETPAHDDLGKGQWKSYLLHTHNISSSVTIFLHILLRQILLSPFDIRKLRLKDAKRFNQCLTTLMWWRQDWRAESAAPKVFLTPSMHACCLLGWG